ncbi:AAA family ATPase [Cyanobacterium aponinum]|uniref:bifunctional aminoglycoside phosphotransferase/ATP-binding protein n=1 Tax=Cyanobacterium aponinum TaxID=379064 RepID=UPI000C12B6D2|nr:AAA family ATPase [Cyanobacterium aponinum]PHV64307.1 adenylyl-sulfate kinase [Cyanobacterium aponinum IPPAS B-1201]
MSQEKLIQRMQQANFYHHPVKEPIEIIQTHCSNVFLTGNYAYKMKKIVDFGFLDYSTLAKRQHFLSVELEMNKQIAPDLYLEVLPIYEENNNFYWQEQGQIKEYVLKMNQFPQENLLLNIYQQGNLTSQHMKELGKLVAKFHQNTVTNEYITSFGTPEKIGESISQNYEQTQKYIGIAQNQEQYEQTKAFTDSFLHNYRDVLEKRQTDHKIKECHGDLHLKNICIWQDKIQLFDRIEFNEPFRFVDVMYDVAFTVMDLDSKGEKTLANVFLNTYLEETGDWEGVQVLPLYLSRQAYVRAKVTSLLLDDRAISEEEKVKAKETAAAYYHLAWQYTQPSQGKIIMMSGLSGSGKTTIATKKARELNAIHIRTDAVRKHLANIPLQEKGEKEIYSQAMTAKTYQKLLDLAKILTIQGFTVILDGKFDRICWRQPVLEFVLNHNIEFEIIYCHAPLDVLQNRLRQRNSDISDATPELLKQQQKQQEAFTEKEKLFLKQG